MTSRDLVRLTHLIERGSGRAEIAVGLIDGPVAVGHPDLATTRSAKEAAALCSRESPRIELRRLSTD
jgi:hypothetical protein